MLGKVAEAAARLGRCDAGAESCGLDAALVPRDDWVPFDDRGAGAWIVRTPHVAFTLPVTGSTVNDYLPSPHQPGRLEVPVQNPLPCGVPVLWRGERQFTSGGLPRAVDHGDHALTLGYTDFPRTARFEADDKPSVAGTRQVEWTVEGRSLVAHERWHFDEVPDALAWQWAERSDTPVSLRVECRTGHRVDTVDVGGLKEWRSFWSELPRVHQVDFAPATDITATLRLTTRLRVGSTAYGHHYHRELYRHLVDEVDDRDSPWGPLRDDRPEEARTLDVFHMHWPEWVAFDDLARHEEIIATLRADGVRIVWTQHNLTPHTAKEHDRFEAVYQRWAEAADGVIHHSAWGRDQVEARYRFRSDAEHRIIRHGHWGRATDKARSVAREAAEAQLGLSPCAIRFGIIGAPRVEKKVQAVMDGFARSRRDDVQLVTWSLSDDDVVPDDPRITGVRYEMVDRATYDHRLRAVDVLVLPFAPDGMLSTGTIGDAIGAGIAVMASDWGYLTETFAAAALPCPLDAEHDRGGDRRAHGRGGRAVGPGGDRSPRRARLGHSRGPDTRALRRSSATSSPALTARSPHRLTRAAVTHVIRSGAMYRGLT